MVFTEGEGTFSIKGLVPYFQVTQKNKNSILSRVIIEFIKKFPKRYGCTAYKNQTITTPLIF